MFKEFKKDKITKLIQIEKENVYDKLKSNDINLLEAHYILEDRISQIYNENNFYYQDLLNRRKFLTSFRSNTHNILISLIFGILGSAICSFILDASKILSRLGAIICDILMIIIILFIAYFMIKSILKTSKLLSDDDPYNVDLYELDEIEKASQKYEDKKQNYNSTSAL